MIHPIPPGLYCVPAALCALTGEPLDAVVVPALNRAARHADLSGDPGPMSMRTAEVALREMGCRVMRYKHPMYSRVIVKRQQLRTWASAWRTKLHPILVATGNHALVLHQGVVYDTKVPGGCDAARHPDARQVLTYAAMVVRSNTAPRSP